MAFLDFAALKESVKIEETLEQLGLNMKLANNQFRGSCPVCVNSGPRSLAITPSKQAFYCFEARTGGDVIALVSHINGCSMKQAAEQLSGDRTSTDTVPRERSKKAARSLQPLSYLEPEHPNIACFGLSAETLDFFDAGYAPKGIMRGKLAVPIHDPSGTLVGYFGMSPEDPFGEPTFPKDFDCSQYVFNVDRLKAEAAIICRHPIDVLMAWQNGVENVVAMLTQTLTPKQLVQLSEALNASGIQHLELP